MLRAGSQLNDAYAGGFVTDVERKKKLTDKSLAYAKRALCVNDHNFCNISDLPFNEFLTQLGTSDEDNIAYIYTLGVSWLSWIQAHSDDWLAITGLAKVEALLKRVVEVDDSYENGSAHLYLGGISTLLPPALGGKPEEGRKHFEKAIEYSQGKNLMAKVVYAQMYARLVFDQELHDKLLNEVLAADPNVENFVLMNTLAQREAVKLLASSPDYF
jgi:tetratricopeptide (TPR) repeat protein